MEIVVSCLHGGALDLQPGIGDAAKQAGVKLFIPNDFGFPLPGYTQSTPVAREGYAREFSPHAAVTVAEESLLSIHCAEHMTRIGLPTTRVLVSTCLSLSLWR